MVEQVYGSVAAEKGAAYEARPPADEPQTLAQGAALLRDHAAAVARLHAAQVDVVRLTDEVRRASVVEPIEGLPLDLYLAVEHGMTTGERWMLLTAGEVLRSMPVTAGLFADGRLSWSQIRDLVARAKRLQVAQRQELDEVIAASVDTIDRLDPDQLRWAVDRACDELDGVARKEAAEDRDAAADFVAVQLGLDGGSKWFARLGPVGTATALGALDARAAGDHPDAPTKAQGRARALHDLCAEDLAGDADADADASEGPVEGDSSSSAGAGPAGDATPEARRSRRGKARPLLVVHIPLDRITMTAAGVVEVDVPGWLPTLSARLVEQLTADADIRAVVFDRSRPLCATRVLRAAEVTPKTRAAVRARDLGDRTPGSTVPITSTQLHHTDRRGEGHHPEHLVSLSKRGHLRVVHRHGWSVQVDGDTGDTVWTRGDRTIRTAPHGTPLHRPPPPGGVDPPPTG